VFSAVESFLDDHDLDQDRYLELRYETLVADPVGATKQLCAFLGEPWSEEFAQFSGKSDDFHKVLSVTGKASTTLKRLGEPLTAGRVGIWRDLLSVTQVDSMRAAVANRGLAGVLRRIEEATPHA
jgi:hypothetical protein